MNKREKITAYFLENKTLNDIEYLEKEEKQKLQKTQEKLITMVENMTMSTVSIADEDAYHAKGFWFSNGHCPTCYKAFRVHINFNKRAFKIYNCINKNNILDNSCENNSTIADKHELRDFLEESVDHEHYIYDEIQKKLDKGEFL
jgi:hypothetical protein